MLLTHQSYPTGQAAKREGLWLERGQPWAWQTRCIRIAHVASGQRPSSCTSAGSDADSALEGGLLSWILYLVRSKYPRNILFKLETKALQAAPKTIYFYKTNGRHTQKPELPSEGVCGLNAVWLPVLHFQQIFRFVHRKLFTFITNTSFYGIKISLKEFLLIWNKNNVSCPGYYPFLQKKNGRHTQKSELPSEGVCGWNADNLEHDKHDVPA